MTSTELLKSLRSLVAYHRSCGLEHYHCREIPGLKLEGPQQPKPKTSAEAGSAAVIHTGAGLAGSENPAPADKNSTAIATLEELALEIQSCTICPLHRTRKVSTAGKGGSLPRLLVIGDWLVHESVEMETLLGSRQDQMLAKMMAAIDLDMSQVFVTNLIKCSVDASLKPDSTHIDACLSYLKQQIRVLTPQVICTMGAAPSQALLGSALPLIRLRGRFHRYRSGDDLDIPVMPTFHPSFLLKNSEMKQSTWEDLQAIGTKLKASA